MLSPTAGTGRWLVLLVERHHERTNRSCCACKRSTNRCSFLRGHSA